jgi:hypothetical protein
MITHGCGCKWKCHCPEVIRVPNPVTTTPKQHTISIPWTQGGNTFVTIRHDVAGSLYIPTSTALNRVWTVWLRDTLTRLLDEDSNVVPPR